MDASPLLAAPNVPKWRTACSVDTVDMVPSRSQRVSDASSLSSPPPGRLVRQVTDLNIRSGVAALRDAKDAGALAAAMASLADSLIANPSLVTPLVVRKVLAAKRRQVEEDGSRWTEPAQEALQVIEGLAQDRALQDVRSRTPLGGVEETPPSSSRSAAGLEAPQLPLLVEDFEGPPCVYCGHKQHHVSATSASTGCTAMVRNPYDTCWCMTADSTPQVVPCKWHNKAHPHTGHTRSGCHKGRKCGARVKYPVHFRKDEVDERGWRHVSVGVKTVTAPCPCTDCWCRRCRPLIPCGCRNCECEDCVQVKTVATHWVRSESVARTACTIMGLLLVAVVMLAIVGPTVAVVAIAAVLGVVVVVFLGAKFYLWGGALCCKRRAYKWLLFNGEAQLTPQWDAWRRAYQGSNYSVEDDIEAGKAMSTPCCSRSHASTRTDFASTIMAPASAATMPGTVPSSAPPEVVPFPPLVTPQRNQASPPRLAPAGRIMLLPPPAVGDTADVEDLQTWRQSGSPSPTPDPHPTVV